MKVTLYILALFVFFCAVYCRIEPLQTLLTVQITDRHRKFRAQESLDTCFMDYKPCDPKAKYRTFDGSCNNLKHPTWGMTNSAFTRLFQARYGDGIESPPTATDGSELPDARELVIALLDQRDIPDVASLSVAQWAQFAAHDLGLPLFKSEILDCCETENPLFCLSIQVPKDDKFYSQYNVTCLPVMRTQTTVTGSCAFNSTKHQINGVTHPVDMSQIYGSDEQTALQIREHKGGRLTMRQDSKGRWFLPTGGNVCFNSKNCYVGGSGRVNQTPQLTVVTTLFVREHNRVAGLLAKAHPTWNDDTLFQETRRFVIAIYQHILYDHFIPKILPSSTMRQSDLFSSGSFKYDDTVPMMGITTFLNPTFRLFHSALQGQISCYDHHLRPTKKLNLSDVMNAPDSLEQEDGFDELILGLLNQPMQTIDEFYTSEIQGKVYHYDKPWGSDLNALDIQRTRDLAIPAYPAVLYACTGREVKNFNDLAGLWPQDKIDKVRKFYRSINDVDLFIGLIAEIKKPGHRLSPLAECVIAEQFYRYKYGDRFWYEVQGQVNSFTLDQIKEIKKFTLSHLICYNSDNITNVAIDAFLPISTTNTNVLCSRLEPINLSIF